LRGAGQQTDSCATFEATNRHFGADTSIPSSAGQCWPH